MDWKHCALCSLPLLCAAGELRAEDTGSNAYKGPYVGLGAGANFLHDETVRDNGRAIGELSFDTGWLGELGLGYALGNGLRPELGLGYRSNRVDGYEPSNKPASGKVTATTAMANLWYDLPLGRLPVKPYVGGGVGAAELEFHHFTNAHNADRSAKDTVFAWQFGAGMELSLGERFALALGYRYLHADEGSFHLDPVDAGHISNAVLLGVRMSLGKAPEPVAAAAPPPPPEPEVAAMETVVVRPVNFKFDKSVITDAARQTLDEIVGELRQYPDLRVEIDGHTDSIGTDAYNMKLGMRRAVAVRDYLVKAGIDAARLSVKSFGESQPVETNKTRDGRAANRRAEFQTSDAPANVKVIVEPPTPESTKAAHGPEDPVPDKPNAVEPKER